MIKNSNKTDSFKENYNSIELFAGAGGMALGLEYSGFNNKLLIENNKWASKTLKTNRKEWNILEKDIQTIDYRTIKESINNSSIDLISGGFPCQPFSYAGKKLGIEDVRGTLFYDFARIVSEIKPKFFLAENVKGLLTHDKGKTLETILQVFEKENYVLTHKVLNSINYGVGQKRQRIFIVGIRNDVYKVVGKEFEFPQPYNYKLNLRDVLSGVPESICASYSKEKKEIFKKVSPGGCWKDLPEKIAKEYMKKSYYSGGGKTGIARRLSWDEPGLTVLCSPMQKQTDRCHPDEIRPFSVRENARIQSFPDEWIFEGSMNEQYKQIGNAVPVNLVKEVGLKIVEYIKEYNEKI